MPWPRNSTETDDRTWEDWQRRFAASDRAAGFEIGRDFRRFSQMNDIFSRAFWDPAVRSEHTEAFFASYRASAAPRRAEGFRGRDFALRNAAWSLSDMIAERAADEGRREGFQGTIRPRTGLAETRAELGSPAEESLQIKKVARFFGADLVGITLLDERWHYTHRPDTRSMIPVEERLPPGCSHVIVLGHAMDFDLVETYPSALAGAATGREYSREAAVAIQLASYIRNLGYEAVASMNDTALVIPYAIKAGLGEYGRNQMVLTPEFGPRVRFSKIFTSLQLEVDAPRRLGIAVYCQGCTICADACPPRALPRGGPDPGPDSPSAIRGVRKWTSQAEKCFGYWARIGTDCAICMRVCPFNRRYRNWRDRFWRWLALGRAQRWTRGLARRWVARAGRRERLKPRDWWAGRG